MQITSGKANDDGATLDSILDLCYEWSLLSIEVPHLNISICFLQIYIWTTIQIQTLRYYQEEVLDTLSDSSK